MRDLYRRGILIAFGEMFLKSEGVRKIFQRKLISNLRFFLYPVECRLTAISPKAKLFNRVKIHSFRERIFVEIRAGRAGRARPSPKLGEGRAQRGGLYRLRELKKVIKNIFGIAWFAETFYFPKTTLKELSEFIDKNYKDWIKKDESFAIRLKKESGAIKKKSEDIINRIAKNINRKVDLSKPDKELFIEIRKNSWFLYFKKKKGAGGLPAGTSGKVLTLMSGGIDSPAAAYLIAKRGAENIWIHFHSFPLVSQKSIEKVEELAKIFLKYQPYLKIYFVPFAEIQKKIKIKAPAKYRVLLYRRLMLKIAKKIAEKENCQALITGESLGQVSSQTLPNLKITEQAVKIPILRPLIGMDKEEIIKLAKKIGTYNISIKPQEDCCILFVSKGQTAKGDIKIVKELEKKLEISSLIRDCLTQLKLKIIDSVY